MPIWYTVANVLAYVPCTVYSARITARRRLLRHSSDEGAKPTSDEVVANASTDPTQMDINQLRQRLDLLLAASQFRAERAGIVSEGVPLRVQTYVQFLEQLATQEQPLTIQAVTPMPIYTVGPLRLQFIALDRDNHEVFRSLEPASSLDPNGAGF